FNSYVLLDVVGHCGGHVAQDDAHRGSSMTGWTPETVRCGPSAVHRANYRFLRFSSSAGVRECGNKLRPGVDVELAVDLPQVELDRLGRQEQVDRDVAIARAALHRGGYP